jgi:ribosomal protein S12 methylthiotransferase accessory factor YcaO
MWREGAHAVVRAEGYPTQAALLARTSHSLGYRSVALHYELKNCGVASLVLLKRDSDSPGPALVAGGGGGSCVSVALDHAMLEAYGMLQHAQSIWPRDDDLGYFPAYKAFLYYLERDPADRLWKHMGIDSLPEIDCPARDDEGASVNFEILHSYQDDIFVVDRGNKLTDYLGLHSVQVIVPGLEVLDRKTMRSGGLPFPLA